jgi:Xaa-Pro dipeptidase
MPPKELWFPHEEFVARVGRVQEQVRSRGLDALIAFHPASVTYLTGFFSTAYTLFSVAIVPADGNPTVVCRDNEEYWLERTGAFEGRILWEDAEAADPAAILARALRAIGLEHAAIGIESATPYTSRLEATLRTLLPDVRLEDCGDGLVASMREIKSPAEIEVMRMASRAVEAGMRAGIAAIRAGTTEREVAAEISGALIRGGSDVAGPGPMGSGERAEHLHAQYEDRVLERGDSVVLEVDGCVHAYYSRFFRTIKVGAVSPKERALAVRLVKLQDQAYAEVRAGAPVHVADRIIRDGILRETGQRYTTNTFGSIGFTLSPARTLSVVETSDWSFASGMTFHSYLRVGSIFFSETLLVTDTGPELLTTMPRELIVTSS